MAMEIINFVMQIGEFLWVPVSREVGYLVHYKRNLDSLNDQAEEFEGLRVDNRELVDAAKMNGQVIKNEVETWLKRADAVITKVERLKDEAKLNKKCCMGWCPDLRSRYKLSKHAVKNTESISELQRKGKFDTVFLPFIRRPPELESTMPTGEFKVFEATKQAMNEVMKAFKDDTIKIAGVYGMGGVGKTMLVTQAGVQARKDGLFNHVIMAVVSQNPNLSRIQGQLADLLAMKLDEESELGRAARLKERIMRGSKLLIILDDLWSRVELYKIGIPSGNELEACKSKILLTTRLEHVCFAMESQVKISLDVLSEQDSWILFRSKAGKDVDSQNFINVAKKIAKECRGLPIALVLVARALGDKDLEEWEEAARRFEMSRPTDLDDDGGVFKCIKLSYDYLKGKDAKPCFLICCLFPEDSEISIEDWVKYGIGKGLFQDASTIEEARSKARSVAKYLKASNLLLESDQEDYVKMHDVVRDIAISIASSTDEHAALVQAGVALKEWPRKDTYEGYNAVSLMSNEIGELPNGLLCPKLETLLLQNNSDIQEIPDDCFGEMKLLRVLDLSGLGISSLPLSFEILANLRTLCLDRCQSISDISMLGKLKKLQILSLRELKIEELPQEIGHLVNLRMLDLTASDNINSVPPKVISSLSHLEELYMQGSFAEWGQGAEGTEQGTNAGFYELTCLPHLNILKVDISDAECIPKKVSFNPKWVKFDICVNRSLFARFMNVHLSKLAAAHSTVLVLDTTINTLPEWFNKVVTENAEKLLYIECRGLNNILAEYDQGRLNGLKSVAIQQCYGIVYLMNSTNRATNQPVFESLEELRVNNMDYLKQICVGQLPHGSLGKLRFLEVEQCIELVEVLLQPNLLQRLQNLEILRVSATSLEEVFRSEGLEEGQVVLLNLREMKLDNLPQLTRIWNGPAHLAIFHNLKIFTVITCKILASLFTRSVSWCLMQLEELWVEDCCALERIIGTDEEEAITKILSSQLNTKEIVGKHKEEAMDEISFPQLKNLSLQNLPQLTSFYSGNATIKCPSLEQLHVQDCPKFRTSTSDFHSNKTIVNDEQHSLLLRKRLLELQ